MCAQLPREEENWSLLAGMPGMDAVEMWPEEQPTITPLSFPSLCTCSMFFLFSQLSAFCEHSFTLQGGLAVTWRAVQGEGQTEEQIRCSGELNLKKMYPVGLSLIALAGHVCVQKV